MLTLQNFHENVQENLCRPAMCPKWPISSRRPEAFATVVGWAFLAALFFVGFADAAEAPEVTVELFSDFQCSFCARFAAPIRELQVKGVEGVRTKVEFRNFPLNFHPDAELAHRAAYAAGEQG